MTLAELLSANNVINQPFLISWLIFKEGAWVIFAIFFLIGLKEVWLNWRQMKFAATREFVILAIDIPKHNMQTPKAVENFFAQLAGAHGSFNKKEIYWDGKKQDWFSFEIISIGGNTQFLIRTVSRFRDLVEASIYAQYPDAEITEIDDYVNTVPRTLPNETHKIWGAEFIPTNNYCYPIKTYPDFEHQLDQEFKDPMAGFLEVLSVLKPTEQVWYQIIVVPIDHVAWRKPCEQVIKKLMPAISQAPKAGLFGGVTGGFINELQTQMTGAYGKTEAPKPGKQAASYLSPGGYRVLEAVEKKISKIAFDVKIRLIYISPKEQFAPSRVINPLVGALKQFTALDLNSLKPDMKRTATKANYLFVKYRINRKARRILSGYRSRSNYIGRKPFPLNLEELATIYHFPMQEIKTPLAQYVQSKKFIAPMVTPYDTSLPAEVENITHNTPMVEDDLEPPTNLPIV